MTDDGATYSSKLLTRRESDTGSRIMWQADVGSHESARATLVLEAGIVQHPEGRAPQHRIALEVRLSSGTPGPALRLTVEQAVWLGEHIGEAVAALRASSA